VKDSGAASGHYRTAAGLTVGSIGLGSYLGDPDDATDGAYEEAVAEFVGLGGNLVDSASNYRAQRSERAIGRALAALVAEGSARREELVVCTKGGYLAHDGDYPRNRKEADEWVQRTLVEPKVLATGDLVSGHAMSPSFLRHQVAQSRANLQLETIDVYYLHNPETQLRELDRGEFGKRIHDAFLTLEGLAEEGRIRAYGCATWNGFRCAPSSDEYLSLEDMVSIARSIQGEAHRFRFVQLPFNLAMLEAARFANQRVAGQLVPLLEAARRLGITCVASATILQARLASGLPPQIAEAFPSIASDALRAIQFNRSTPHLAATLVGMSQVRHVLENLGLAKRPPGPAETVKKLLLKLG